MALPPATWQLTQVALPIPLWSNAAPLHLVKLAVVDDVWQVSHAAVVVTWVGLASLLPKPLPLLLLCRPSWQVAQAVVLTEPWSILSTGLNEVLLLLWQVSQATVLVGMCCALRPSPFPVELLWVLSWQVAQAVAVTSVWSIPDGWNATKFLWQLLQATAPEGI